MFPLEYSYRETADEEDVNPSADEVTNDDTLTQPLPAQTHPAPAIPNPYAPPDAATDSGKYGHGFGWEHRAWDAGVMGGLAIMAIAAVWYFGGRAIGIRFHYPVILFFFGLAGFIRGLFKREVIEKL